VPPLSTEFVLAEEAAAVHGGTADPIAAATGLRHHRRGVKLGVGNEDAEVSEEEGKRRREFYRRLNKHDSAALCLSGGGIRSAAFSLGVIEALARNQVGDSAAQHPDENAGGERKPKDHGKPENSLLAQFHYLSTVSGGGYIGSWLSAWCRHAHFETVWRNLVGRPRGPDVETATIGWLRAYSNYLTPKLGLLSGDFWAAIAICLRNLLLNWLVIIPLLCIVLLLIKLVAVFAIGVAHYPPHAGIAGGFGLAGAAALIFALALITRERPTRRPPHDAGVRQGTFLRWMLLPSLLAAGLFIQLGASNSALDLLDHHGKVVVIGLAAVAGAVIYALGWIFAGRRHDERDFGYWTLSGVAFGALLGVGAYAYNLAPVEGFPLFNDLLLPVIFGVPWVIASQMIAEMLFVAFSSYQKNSDSDREWLGRAAGWYLLAALGWLIGTVLIFAGSLLAEGILHGFEKWLASVGGVAGAVTALIGNSRFSQGRGPQAKGAWPLTTSTILAIAAPLFLAALIVLLAEGLDWLMFDGTQLVISLRFPGTEIGTSIWWKIVVRLLGALGVAAVVAFFASYFVNINRFSLHALYRNRLVRAFLGASRPRRHPDDFTDFDVEDNIRVRELWRERPRNGTWPKPERARWRPFHVINMALNIVSSHHLSWQERKAESFTVSPLHAGSACKAYRPTREYGARDGGITLGTAVAISGAAASPNMGYHSSPGITLLLALFNVRLGWWLGNPGPEGENTYRDEGPKLAAVPLVEETFGLTTDDRPYVYLSDGGHFENLGIYEMVRRRCRFIISVDAGADPDYGFEDLGNAQRKIAIDLGVPIRFYGLTKLKKRRPEGRPDIGPGHPYHAVGVIDYPTADHGGEPGYILYIKAGYHGVEGPGVCSYAVANATFPHQSTADQWFSESQFESYRALGFTIADRLFADTYKNLSTKKPTLEEIFKQIAHDVGKGP
jgi:Patatin-like phospholipase